MDRRMLLDLIQAALPLALGVALVTASLMFLRHRRNTAAIRRRMAEINAGTPGLTAISGGKATRQSAWRRRHSGRAEGKESRAA